MSRQKNNLTELDRRRIQKNIQQTKQNWSEVDEIYQALGEGLIDVGEQVNKAVSLINQVADLNKDEVTITVRGLTSDISAFADDLAKIRKRHEGYTGVIKDENELALCLSVFSDYSILSERFKAITFNPMLTISEFLAEASDRIMGNQPTNTIEGTVNDN